MHDQPSLKALVFVAAVLVVGLRMAPLVLDRIAQIASRELFVLGVAALALGMALASEEVGLSVAFGAFLGGMIVSESEVSHRVLADMLPARDVFGALFFVSVGMLIDPDVLAGNVVTVVALLAVIVAMKGVIAYALAKVIGYGSDALPLAMLIAQAGEFGFVIAGVGIDRGVVDTDIFTLVVSATAVSMALTPALMLALRALQPGRAPATSAQRPLRARRAAR
jgi:CPA2 family monovalent cation:H+ antiporter-2